MGDKTVTVKSSGGTYTSLNAALAGELVANPDLTAMNGVLTIECYDLGAADGPANTGAGWTTDATRYIHIVAPTGQRHDGKWNTSKYRIEFGGNSASIGAFTNQAPYTKLTGIQIKRYSTANFDNLYGVYAVFPTTGTTIIDSCIIWMRSDHGACTGRGISHTLWDYTVRNTVLFANGSFGGIDTHAIVGNTSATIDNCTIHGFKWSVDHGGTALLVRNVCSQATLTGDYYVGSSSLTGSTNNISSRADAPGSNPLNNRTGGTAVAFVDAANGDFHLSPSDTQAKDAGADLSATFTVDIDGATRSGTWDVGADEITSGALTAGTASGSATGTTTTSMSVVTASGGTAPYTYQWYRSTSSGFTPGGGNIVSGATSTTLNDTGLTAATTYYYKNVVTDNVAATATSNEASVTTNSLTPVRGKTILVL